MSHKTLNQLPAETIKLIASTQIITSISTAVKELVENSLDAEARNIQVQLNNYGFDVLEVKDDGHGISYANVQRMFLPGYTSKIACFNDLGKLQTYGFRGEALSALAKLSNVSITTKTSADTLAMTYVINNEGIPDSSKPSHITKGTIITATNIFGNLPVRKQYLSSKKKVAEELKKVEHVLQSLSAIHPELRISLIHNKCPIWQKNSVKGMKPSFMQVVGLRVVSKMEHLNELGNNILVDLIVPKKDLDNVENLFTSSRQSIFLYVNRRPVILGKISKVVMEHIFLKYNHLNPTSKYVTCLISVEVPPQEIDVNLEPNKTKIYLKNETEVINLIDNILSTYYEQRISRPEPEPEEPITGRELDNEEEEEKEEEEDSENQERKRPRLEQEQSLYVSSVRDKEFIDKNNGWRLEIITAEDVPQPKSSAFSLCSQINRENCTLATSREVGELNKLLNENSQKLVTSVRSDSESRLSDRNDIQSHNKPNYMKETANAEEVTTPELNGEKPILPEWPKREIPLNPSQSDVVNDAAALLAHDISDLPDLAPQQNDENPSDEGFLDKIDLYDWSRGAVETEHGLLQGGAILARPNPAGEGTSHAMEDDLEQFDLSVRSVSSQMGRKELSAFTKFTRIMRPKILKEFPGIIFTKVAGLLVDRWKALPIDDKKYYEKLSKEVDVKREIHKEIKTLQEFKNFEPVVPNKKKAKAADKKPERLELKLTVSLEMIKQQRETKWQDPPNNEIQPLGQLQPSGNWLYKKGSEIGHVRHVGLQELILSQRMLSNHSVPREPAPKAILINEDIVGQEMWGVLVGLETEFDPLSCRYTVVSPVVAKNGFKIDLEKREGVFSVGWITEVASMIPFYGVTELRDALALYREKGEFADLGSLRSTAVINYITNEAVRIAQQTPRPPDLKDLKEWIDTWQMYLTHLPPRCLHCRDIFVPVYTVQRDSPKC